MLSLVDLHRLSGVVVDALTRSGCEQVQASLRQSAYQLAAISLRTKRLLHRALDALEQREVRPLILKGYGLAARYYPEPLSRPTSDVDLLIRPEETERAEEGLARLGLAPMSGPTRHFSIQHHHHVTFSGSAGLVELHFRALSDFGVHLEADVLLQSAGETVVDGRTMRFAAPEDELLYLAVHAAHHLCQRLVWLLDLKLLIRAVRDLSWERLVTTADAAGVSTAAHFALRMAKDVMAAEVPAEVLRRLRPPAWQSAAVQKALSPDQLIRGTAVGSLREEVLKKALLATGPLSGARYLQQIVARSLRRRTHRLLPGITPTWWAG
ncbi:MAG: nucleotidyltransferase family protein [Myxococcaceae bacterium]|nr:nucleotidyltransferase family protein [Myxococcaceae bacterium]